MECHEEDLGEDHYEGEECAGCHTNERLYPEEEDEEEEGEEE